MAPRFLTIVLALLALVMFVGQPVLADETHEGTVVKAGDGKLTMKDKEGKKEHSHKIGATVKITCDGKECKLEDLKAGDHVKVTTKDKDKDTVVKIEAKRAKK